MRPDLAPSVRGTSRTQFFVDQHNPKDPEISIMDMHLYAVGQSFVPTVFHRWAFLSVISSCVMNRVGFDGGVQGNPITPQLYVMLMANSGVGKGVSIASALSYLCTDEDPALFTDCHVLMGEFTSSGIFTWLAQRYDDSGTRYKPLPHAFLVAEELKNSLKDRVHADRVIAFLTAHYGGKPMHADVTRTSGINVIYRPHINLLAGTTEDWLTACLEAKDLRGGFGPRTMFIYGKPEMKLDYKEESIRRIDAPPDQPEISSMIRQRLRTLTTISGLFQATPKALDALNEWEKARTPPDDPDKEGVYNRDVEVLLRLAMLRRLCYAQKNSDLILNLDDLTAGYHLLVEGRAGYDRIVELSYMTPDMEKQKRIEARLMRACAPITIRDLQNNMSRKGITAGVLRHIVSNLTRAGVVKELPHLDCVKYFNSKQARYYLAEQEKEIMGKLENSLIGENEEQ